MATMMVDVVSLEELIFSGEVEYLVAPGHEGELGIFPHHIQLINHLKPGVLRLKLPNQEMHLIFAISGGFLEVQSNKATILADVVERSEKLDEAKLIEQKRLAQERLGRRGADLNEDDAKAYAALELIIAQLKALEYANKQSRRVN